MTAAAVRQRLEELSSAGRAASSLRFFKTGPGEYGEGDRFRGISVPPLRALAREYAGLPLSEILKLLNSPLHEDRLLALFLLNGAFARGDAFVRRQISTLYLANTARINNWDLVDSSAEHIVGAWLFDRSRRPLGALARSANLWERRIAIIATFHFIRRDDLDTTLAIARILIADREDLIHKAVGWMLREVGKRDARMLEHFLEVHAAHMPRTMLRLLHRAHDARQRARYMKYREQNLLPKR